MGFAISLANSVLNLLSADQCHMTVSWAQVYNSLRWRVFLDYLLTSYCFLIDHGLRSKIFIVKGSKLCLVDGFDHITQFVFAHEHDFKLPLMHGRWKLLPVFFFFVFILRIALKNTGHIINNLSTSFVPHCREISDQPLTCEVNTS